MVNDCGHSLCNSCVQLLFSRGQAPCPQVSLQEYHKYRPNTDSITRMPLGFFDNMFFKCHINLKKSGWREQMFDDPMVDKEVNIRTKISKIYNKRYPEDFRKMLKIFIIVTLITGLYPFK